MGGDAPNEDEYSAAPERLLEGCPASTHSPSQIGDTVNGGGARFHSLLVNGEMANWREKVEMIKVTVGPKRCASPYFTGKLQEKDDKTLFVFHYGVHRNLTSWKSEGRSSELLNN